MIDVLENSNAPLYNYNLINVDGDILESVKLTEFEAKQKNYAFGLNHIPKSYKKVGNVQNDSNTKLILPDQ